MDGILVMDRWMDEWDTGNGYMDRWMDGILVMDTWMDGWMGYW